MATREDVAKRAIEMYNYCANNFQPEIQYSIANSVMFDKTVSPIPLSGGSGVPSEYIYEDLTTEEALFKYASMGRSVVVLNFASYFYPGGGFLSGAMAQEESLCHHSFLYNVLSNECFAPYYAYNKQNPNSSLYLDRAIYSPGVRFFAQNTSTLAGVITCASPNTCNRTDKEFKAENSKCLRSRIELVYAIAERVNPDVLIMGAFGCGVFGQEPTEVAAICRDLRNKTILRTVAFAVPKKFSIKNYQAFLKIGR